MNHPDKKYLEHLIEQITQKCTDFKYPELDLSAAVITYIPTKKRYFTGLRSGMDGLAEMKKYNVKESPAIRPNCMFYHKFYKADGKILKIDSFVSGHDRLAGGYIAYYEDNWRYLFPVDGDKIQTGSYILATHFENNRVVEECFVLSHQIVYEKYTYPDSGKVDYYYINYVPAGKYPVLAEHCGYYFPDTLEYVDVQHYAWYTAL